VMTMRCVVLFADVHEFSKATVLLGDRLGEFMQQMYETLGGEIVRAHGTIVKYIGDAILAVFADKAEVSAVRCGLAMRPLFAALVARWKLAESTVLEVGIASGLVVRGTFGHESLRMEDVFGEAVNVAAVIGHILGVTVTGPVRDRIKDAFELDPLEPWKLKWRQDPVAIWAARASGAPEGATPRG
jgi:class 3 adenylate cyclase